MQCSRLEKKRRGKRRAKLQNIKYKFANDPYLCSSSRTFFLTIVMQDTIVPTTISQLVSDRIGSGLHCHITMYNTSGCLYKDIMTGWA